jgi:Fe-S oxidoreductase
MSHAGSGEREGGNVGTKAYFMINLKKRFGDRNYYRNAIKELKAMPEVVAVEPVSDVGGLLVEVDVAIRETPVANKIEAKKWVKSLKALNVESPFQEAVNIVREAGGEALQLCYQCGLCGGICPWNTARSFDMRRIIHQAQLGVVDFEAEEIWLCATCNACVKRCPRGVEIINIMRALRRTIVELGVGAVPDSLRISVKNVAGAGNPLGEAPEERATWAEDMEVKSFTKGTDLLYFPGCLPAYEPRDKVIARATVEILKKAGIDFGILGIKETCCGESIRKAGNENLFRRLAESNISTFAENGVRKVLVSSPHCYHTFRNEYPEFGSDFEVIHSSQYLLELIKAKKLTFTKELKKKVTYHDPCYLGRHNGIYEEPREVLRSIPGLELVEMTNSGEDSFCCGGGGGGIWMETKKGERLADIRLEQAIETGAEVLAVSCPYCMVMFKDSQMTVDRGETIEIKDITELVQQAI